MVISSTFPSVSSILYIYIYIKGVERHTETEKTGAETTEETAVKSLDTRSGWFLKD